MKEVVISKDIDEVINQKPLNIKTKTKNKKNIILLVHRVILAIFAVHLVRSLASWANKYFLYQDTNAGVSQRGPCPWNQYHQWWRSNDLCRNPWRTCTHCQPSWPCLFRFSRNLQWYFLTSLLFYLFLLFLFFCRLLRLFLFSYYLLFFGFFRFFFFHVTSRL